MSNFSFINTAVWKHIYQDAAEAEKLVLISPKAATIMCRSAMELGVQWLYENDISWTKYQLTDNWFYFKTRIGKQRPGIRDNNGTYADYSV